MKLIYRFLIIMVVFVTTVNSMGRMHWTAGTDKTYTALPEGNPFTCSIDSFVFVSEAKDYPTDGYGLDLFNQSAVDVQNFYQYNINAIGYNVKDNYIWGYDREGEKVVRIDDNYHVKSYTIAGLPSYSSTPSGGYHIGDVSVNGILHLATKDDSTKIYKVDLNPTTPVILATITLSGLTFDTADFAFHPTNGKIYLPDDNSNNLYEIDFITNKVTSIGSLGVATFTGSNVVFFDKDNNFYFNNGSDDNIYKIDLTDPLNPSSTSIYVEFEIPSQGDGARCMNAPMQETKDKKIKGKIFEDIDGDGVANASSNIDNATVYLYKDTDNNSSRDAASVLYGTVTTDLNGEYEFDVSNGKYFVVVDSKTITKGSSSFPDIWAEQTYAPKGGLCNDGGWGEVKLNSSGACYGGWRGNWDDDASALSVAEHVAIVDINDSNSLDVDFGFSFNIVVSPEETGQGSLRQFIKNANLILGENKMRFVPAVVKNESAWWSIKLTKALPVIEDDKTTIDGTAYNPNGSIRDENSGVVGSGVKLGTGVDGVIDSGDEPTLTLFNKPELEININRQAVYGIKAYKSDDTIITDITIKNIAIYGSNDISWNDDSMSDIVVYGYAKNIDISGNFVGVRADGGTLSGTNRTRANGITLYTLKDTISDFKIYNNYVLDIGNHAIYTLGDFSGGGFVESGKIYQNEVARAAWAGIYEPDGMTIEVGSKDIEIYENYVYECSGGGFDTWEAAGEIKWYDNTVYKNGFGVGKQETFGLRSISDNNEIYRNHIYGNSGSGIAVVGFTNKPKETYSTKISKNSIYDNSISIDLDQTNGPLLSTVINYSAGGDGPTPNDGDKNSTLQNMGMDYPVFTKVIFDTSGTKLYLKGYVGLVPNQSIFKDATVEVYKAGSSGGGKWYLGTFKSDADGNFDLNITISSNVTLQYEDKIVATATDTNGNTSEFGESFFVEDSVPLGCLQNAIILNDSLNIYELDTILGNKYEFTNKLQQLNNAIGYNHKDGYVWGYNNDDLNGTFVRIGKDLNGEYVTKIFGPVIGIPAGHYFNVGDIDKDGHLFMLDNSSQKDVYVVDLDSSSSTFLELIRSYSISNGGSKLDIQDWAFHPKNGKLYAVRYNGAFYEVDPSKSGQDAVKEEWNFIIGLDDNGSISYEGFFDDNGYFYTYAAHAGKVYRIDLTDPDNPNPNAVLFAPTFAGGTGGDSTRCNKATMGDVPIIEIKDAKILEGHSGSKKLKFLLFSDRPITDTGGLRVDYSVTGSDANVSVGDDYAPPIGYKVIPMGEQNATIEIEIFGDTDVEKDEKFFVDITLNPNDYYAFDSQAEGIIINDDYDIELRVVDTTNSFDFEDGKISTKIVNRAFDLTVLAYNHTLDKPQSDLNITKVELENDVLWSGSLLTDADGKVDFGADSLTISRALKEANLKIYGDLNTTHKYDSISSDKFSVRPETFSITLPISSKAGDSFNFTIQALDQGGNPAEDYNETNSSFTLKYKQNNESNCSAEGNLTLPNLHFQDGEATYSVKYSEAGRLDFNISEIMGNEFALVDAGDTIDGDRIISIAENSIAFVPDRFDVNWTMGGESNYANMLFFADANSVSNMGAGIVAKVKALSVDGNVTKNYTNGCLSHNTSLTINFGVAPATTEKLIWQDMNDNDNNNSIDIATNFVFNINASAYNNGEANASLKVNFSREANKPKNPLRFTVSKIKASANSSLIVGESSHNERLDIYYGRLHVPDLSIEGADMEANALHEVYCDGCDSSIFTQASGRESADSINWYMIGANATAIVGNATSRSNIVQDTTSNIITLQASRLPFVDRVWYVPKSWLLYNRYSATIIKHSFRAEFTPDTSVWSGKGEEGTTMQRDSSRRINQKMDW